MQLGAEMARISRSAMCGAFSKALIAAIMPVFSLWPLWSVQSQQVPVTLRFADAIRMAEAANPTYLADQSKEALTQAKLRQARARPNPKITVESESLGAFSRGSEARSADWISHLVQEIETAGKRRYRAQAARAGVMMTRASILESRRELHMAVGSAYLSLALQESNYQALRIVYNHIQIAIDRVAQRVKQGDAAATALMRLQLEQVRLRDDMLQASLILKQAQVKLWSLLGAADVHQPVAAADSLVVATLIDADGMPIATLEGVMQPMSTLLSIATHNRPDLKSAAHEVDQALANVALQRALRIPNVEIEGGYRGSVEGNHVDAGIVLDVPFWGSLDGGGLQHAQAMHNKAVATLQAAKEKVKAEVTLAFTQVNGAAERVKLLTEQHLMQVEELEIRVQTAYTLGETPLTVLIDLQRIHLEALQVRNEAVFDFRMSQTALAVAMGITPLYQYP